MTPEEVIDLHFRRSTSHDITCAVCIHRTTKVEARKLPCGQVVDAIKLDCIPTGNAHPGCLCDAWAHEAL